MVTSTIKRTLATAVVAAIALAPVAWAMPLDPVGTGGGSGHTQTVPPPPSSIAVSAAEEYDALRSAGAEQVGPKPVADAAPSGGFDFPSAAIGAASGGALIALAAAGLAWRRPLTRRHSVAGA